MPGIGIDLHAQRPVQPCDLPHVASHLGRIDIHGADDAESITRGELARHHQADRTEAVQQYADHEKRVYEIGD